MRGGIAYTTVGLVLAAAVGAVPIEERAVDCEALLPSMNADLAAATRFCTVYLQIIPKTTTNTNTMTRLTRTQTIPDYTTTTAIITPATQESSLYKTVTESTTITPGTKTVTDQETSTAYLDPYGSTIALMKRDVGPSPMELAPRAIVTPSYFRGLRKTDIRAACACMELSTPTYTRQRTIHATATVTQALHRTIRQTTTLATVVTPTTITATKGVTVVAPSPQATETSWAVEQIKGCPPNTASTWLCPQQTGDDDGSHDNYLSCSVMAQDAFYGYCLYWDDDGSPAGSTLIKGDGSGDASNDQVREAVYGDADTDDCPSWSDWTCAASGGQKRSVLEKMSDEYVFQKRGFVPKRMSVSEHRRAGKKRMPHGLRRGGKYRKTVDYHKLMGKGAGKQSAGKVGKNV